MGKKKEPSINDSLDLFKDIAKRSSTSAYKYVDRNVFSINDKNLKVAFNIDLALWNAIMNDEELKKQFTEFNLNDEDDRRALEIFKYTNDLENGWVPIDGDKIFKNELMYINIEGFEYMIPLNKTIYPLRFKKSEMNNFGYKITTNPLVLTVKKTFVNDFPDSSFTLFRVFHII